MSVLHADVGFGHTGCDRHDLHSVLWQEGTKNWKKQECDQAETAADTYQAYTPHLST